MMDIPSGIWSTGALMRVVVTISLEMLLLREVWMIVVLPYVTIGLLAINLGFVFLVVLPRSWQTWIRGMLLGSVAGVVVAILLLALEGRDGLPGVIGRYMVQGLENWTDSLADPDGETARLLRAIGRHIVVIEGVLVDILGIGMAIMGGCLDHAGRRRAPPLLPRQGRSSSRSGFPA